MAAKRFYKYGLELNSIRVELNLTQQETADLLGMSRELISAFETGREMVPKWVLNNLKFALAKQRKYEDISDQHANTDYQQEIDEHLKKVDKVIHYLENQPI